MSRYTDYTEVAKHYDGTRVPVGAEILIGLLARLGASGSRVRLLDAGCGTGAYSELALAHVDHIDAIDLNEGMLAVARGKFDDGDRIAFHQGSIEALPFEAACFDAVMYNQVLHHLEPGDGTDFPGHRAALAEAHRVLRPGGLVIVNTTIHEQLRQGFWYLALIPATAEAFFQRCISTSALEAILVENGFELEGRSVPLDGVLSGEAYFDAEGPLNPAWRAGESSWSLASVAEVSAAEETLHQLRTSGGLDAYMAEQDAGRRRVGQTTYFVARRA